VKAFKMVGTFISVSLGVIVFTLFVSDDEI